MLNDSIIAKIQKLISLSKGTHSRHESEVAMAMATRLMMEHQITEAQLQVDTSQVNDPLDLTGNKVVYETKKINLWKNNLVAGLAELNGLFVLVSQPRDPESHRKVSRYQLIGKESAIQITIYMFDAIVAEIGRWADVEVPSRGKRGVSPERESYSLGCVNGFIAKMMAEKNEALKKATSQAMVLIKNQADDAKKAWMIANNRKKDLKETSYRSKATISSSYEDKGFARGQTMNVNQGLGSSSTAKPNQLY